MMVRRRAYSCRRWLRRLIQDFMVASLSFRLRLRIAHCRDIRCLHPSGRTSRRRTFDTNTARCRAMTILATPCRPAQPTALARTARTPRWLSVSRSRRPPRRRSCFSRGYPTGGSFPSDRCLRQKRARRPRFRCTTRMAYTDCPR